MGRRQQRGVRQMSKSESLLFEDIFEVFDDPEENRKFDRVSRLQCRGVNFEMEMTVDVNTDIYPVAFFDKLNVALASTLNLDGSPDGTNYEFSRGESLLDKYEYVMYGKVFNQTRDDNNNIAIFVSFGGQLMKLKGEPQHLNKLQL